MHINNNSVHNISNYRIIYVYFVICKYYKHIGPIGSVRNEVICFEKNSNNSKKSMPSV